MKMGSANGRDGYKKREKPQGALQADVFEIPESVILCSSRVFLSFRGDCPSSFGIPCWTFFGSGGWRHRLVDGFAALCTQCPLWFQGTCPKWTASGRS
jgi:hypothetical protein